MKTQRRRGGAPFRLKDPTQFIEAEIKKFFPQNHDFTWKVWNGFQMRCST